MAVAEHITKVHAICVRCGDPAQYSHRLSDSTRLVELGEKIFMNLYADIATT